MAIHLLMGFTYKVHTCLELPPHCECVAKLGFKSEQQATCSVAPCITSVTKPRAEGATPHKAL